MTGWINSMWRKLNGWEPVVILEENEGHDEVTWVLHLNSRLYTRITDKADGSFHKWTDRQDSLDPVIIDKIMAEGKQGWHRTT